MNRNDGLTDPCPNCSVEVSIRAKDCPHCGYNYTIPADKRPVKVREVAPVETAKVPANKRSVKVRKAREVAPKERPLTVQATKTERPIIGVEGCVACGGTGYNSRGGPCSPCQVKRGPRMPEIVYFCPGAMGGSPAFMDRSKAEERLETALAAMKNLDPSCWPHIGGTCKACTRV